MIKQYLYPHLYQIKIYSGMWNTAVRDLKTFCKKKKMEEEEFHRVNYRNQHFDKYYFQTQKIQKDHTLMGCSCYKMSDQNKNPVIVMQSRNSNYH